MFKNISYKILTKAQIIRGSFFDDIKRMNRKAKNHIMSENKAQGIIEYGLLLAVVAVALIGTITLLKNKIADKINEAIKGIGN